ncbi:bifunctional adenosylcobinamide kinase/adenosylcobinamide-phosphate guanylyltransferase [Sinobaca sp. H24]|uniref:bifunctional adenosylcobinamide kinase/adenosylcobinamide-phosphate guanylyltransferase n=1 Tax=Sinobaca sp. H24 TaxID=2923376 RepID=UPI002079FEBC|nr:bifunctional adenosylcobinamide kinase/adenosylcobinamide-phosphate guanylyltransferase [Sinobaca sp. H24]
MLIFIEGGAKSGKTSFAEHFIQQRQGNRKVYLAAADPQDAEMIRRINSHQCKRQNAREQWVTIEQPFDLMQCIEQVQAGDHVLLDCLTTWLSNEMFSSGSWHVQTGPALMLEALLNLQKKTATLLVVSSDISHQSAGHPDMIQFLKVQGRLSSQIVKRADLAGMVNYGCLRPMKGEWQ